MADLLRFFPRAYEDRSRVTTISALQEGVKATIHARITSKRKIPARGRTILEARVADSSGAMSLKWFYAPRGLEEKLRDGAEARITGTPRLFMGRPEMAHPELSWGPVDVDTLDVGRVIPIYTELEGVSTRVFRRILWNALGSHSKHLSEDIPKRFLDKYGLPGIEEAMRTLHFPSETSGDLKLLSEFNTRAHHRLIYEEFFKFEYLVLTSRMRLERERAVALDESLAKGASEVLIKGLPFALTGDQNKAVLEILGDLTKPHPMNRLIQGDVGAGKTAVALIAVGATLAAGGQAALMAPTEILAEQHFQSIKRLFGDKLSAAILTGKTGALERRVLLSRLLSGEPLVLIGTHALIESDVIFKNLVLVIIDEQQRFGVEQRRALREKGALGERVQPHLLVMSATPIPRTLALTAYGDLSVTLIREMPPGRKPVRTHVVRDERRARAYDRITQELRSGRQAYFVFPLVSESEAEGFTELKAASVEAERLAQEVFKEFKVALLHGQMKPQEKALAMEEFRVGRTHVLVSTTVIEVGVDNPNATVMAVEHAERFGLSQLHQLRGRVGRGSHESLCFLFVARYLGEQSALRIEALERTQDGFAIAEADLEIRGPGEFLGTKQAGGLPFRLAHLVRDQDWLFKARDDVMELLREDPDLNKFENRQFSEFLAREGAHQMERLKTS